MRLIDSFEDENTAYTLHALLIESGIESSLSTAQDASTHLLKHQVWVVNEEDMDKALGLYETWRQDPTKRTRQDKVGVQGGEALIKTPIRVNATSPLVLMRHRGPLTRWVIILCAVIFLWNGYQKGILMKNSPALVEYFGLTPLIMKLIYDVPVVFQEIYQFFISHPDLKVDEMESWPAPLQAELNRLDHVPYWQGFYERIAHTVTIRANLKTPPFTQIAQGEIWRLFTPAILHANFLHILFNMLWLWLLGKEVESKIGKIRYVVLMILVGMISNTAQYVMSGPLFMGYSGVICGLGGFIWVRQKKAPWEGYIVPQGTLLFLFIFILGMLVLQTIGLIVSKMHLGEFSIGKIGNTAHIVGALCGLLFARIPFFYRLRS